MALRHLIALGTLAVAGLSAAPARPATIRVPADVPSLQAAIDAAAVMDTILVAPGLYAGPENRDLDLDGKDLVICSEGGAAVTTIDASKLARVVSFDGQSDATVLDGFTISGGNGHIGGGIRCGEASPRIINCIFTDNLAHEGGGLGCVGTVGPTVEDCRFSSNEAEGGAGLAIRYDSTARIIRCVFSGNRATPVVGWGGGISVEGTATITDCLLIGNEAGTGGGIAYIPGYGTVSGCTIVGNRPQGIWVRSTLPGSDVALRNTIVAFNGALGVQCPLPMGGNGITSVECCDIFGNGGGDWVGTCLEDLLNVHGNISADPLFCNRDAGDVTLQENSPCSPSASGSCGLIGALDVGCGAIAVEEATWGEIKAIWGER